MLRDSASAGGNEPLDACIAICALRWRSVELISRSSCVCHRWKHVCIAAARSRTDAITAQSVFTMSDAVRRRGAFAELDWAQWLQPAEEALKRYDESQGRAPRTLLQSLMQQAMQTPRCEAPNISELVTRRSFVARARAPACARAYACAGLLGPTTLMRRTT